MLVSSIYAHLLRYVRVFKKGEFRAGIEFMHVCAYQYKVLSLIPTIPLTRGRIGYLSQIVRSLWKTDNGHPLPDSSSFICPPPLHNLYSTILGFNFFVFFFTVYPFEKN